MEQIDVITDETGKIVKSNNNGYIYEVLDKENKVKFLDKIVKEKFNNLYDEYENKKIAIDTLKQLIINTLCSEVGACIVCNDGIYTLIPTTSILVTSCLFSLIPIKSIKKINKNIDELEMIIPGLQEELVNTNDEIYKIKTDKKHKYYNKKENIELKEYTEDNIYYEYSNNKKRVKVKIR